VDDLVRRETAVARQLRDAWMGCWVIVLTLDPEIAQVEHVSGYVERVSPTNAVVDVEEIGGAGMITVPCCTVLTVRRPHFHEPLDAVALKAERRLARNLAPTVDGQMTFELPLDNVDDRW
jgi:hypothetical protein